MLAALKRLPGLLLAVAAIAAGLVTQWSEAPPTYAETLRADGDLVREVSVSHEIEFGVGVRVQLEARVDAAPEEIRAVFATVGDRRVSSYAYPEFATSPGGELVNAEFTIKTGGSAYVPPGAIFEVFFEFTGPDGSITSTESSEILYLDPSKDWRIASSPDVPLDFYYYGFSNSLASSLLERVSGTWLDIANTIGVDPNSVETYRAIIYPNMRELSRVFPPTSAASTDGAFFGGFAMHRFGVFVLGSPSADSSVHEFTHLLVDTKVDSPLSRGVPSWLHEGLAQFFEAGSSSAYSRQLGRAASEDRLLTLRNRNTVPARAEEIGLFYTQVGSFVGELIEDNGPGPMARTLELINEGNTAAEAIEIAYGVPLWQLENEWRDRLGASKLPPPPEPTAGPDAQATPTPRAGDMTVATQPSGNAVESTAPAATIGSELTDVGVIVETAPGSGDEDNFDWTGPFIGAAIAGLVFFVWSVRVNRRRFRSYRD